MNTIDIKNNIHRLIDQINDDKILSRFYEILEKASSKKEGALWSNLTLSEQEELLRIDKETDDESNLISFSEMKSKHKKWLE
nr:hypothetical protein [uncultured Carboxylicivirga sp.]